MHNLYLCWLQHFYGSVFYLLMHECLTDTPLRNLSVIESFIKIEQSRDRTRQRYRQRLSKLSMFVEKKGYPKLKGRASDIRGLDLSLWKCWKHFMDVESLQRQSIEMFLRLNVEVGTLLNEHGPRQGHFGMPSPFAEQAVQKGWLNYTSCLWNTLPIQSFNCPTAPANCTSCCIHWSWLNIVTHTSRGASRMKAIWESFSNCGSHAFQATNIVQSEM